MTSICNQVIRIDMSIFFKNIRNIDFSNYNKKKKKILKVLIVISNYYKNFNIVAIFFFYHCKKLAPYFLTCAILQRRERERERENSSSYL